MTSMHLQFPRPSRAFIAALALALANGCSATADDDLADVGEAGERDEQADRNDPGDLGTVGLALTRAGQFPFIGSIPLFPTEVSQPFGSLSLIRNVGVGLRNDHVVNLNVCWYRPSNPDNQFRNGDENGCTLIGREGAEDIVFAQLCPVGFVASGYTAKLSRSGNSIDTFGLSCISLTDPTQTTSSVEAGESESLFSQLQFCGVLAGQTPAYLEALNMNANGDGLSGSCVTP